MQVRYMKYIVVVLTILCVSSLILGLSFFDYINHIDIKVLNFVRINLTSSALTNFMKFISWLISPVPIITVILAIFIVFRKRKWATYITVNTVVAGLINYILKNIFRRGRPFEYMLMYVKGYSFPSAHAMISAIFLCSLIFFCKRNIKNKSIKNFVSIILIALLILVPISRVYLGVHNLTDVYIGSLMGFILFLISAYIIKKKDLVEVE